MNDAAGVELVERGLVASWTRQARWVAGSSLHHLGGLLVVLSGIRDQTQHVALVEAPVDDPEATVVAAEVLFERARWRPAFDLAAGHHPAIEQVLIERGFQVVVSRPGMVRSVVTVDWPSSSAPVDLELAVSRDRHQIVEVQGEAFGLDPATAAGLVPDAVFADHDAVLIVARARRKATVVGSITVHLDGAVGAVIGAAVRPAHRRLGIGTGLTVAALDVARSHGAETVWLQATPDGEPIYRALGFTAVAPFQVWVR